MYSRLRVVHSAHDYAQFLNPRKLLDDSGLPLYRWKRPPTGVLKLNVDGSCNLTFKSMATGGLIRNDQGEWHSGFTTNEDAGDSLLAELLAIKNGLLHAWDKGARDIICESNSADVISLLNLGVDRSFHVYRTLLQEISTIAARPWHLKFVHVMHETNTCADFLAKIAVQVQRRWMDWLEAPVQLETLLLCDGLLDPP